MSNLSLRKAILINFVAKYSNVFIQLIINSVLARLLTPNDFGIVAIISVFITFFTIMADMGIGPAIIQNKELKEDEVEDIFSFTFYIAIFISFGFSIFSIPLSILYGNKVYIILGIILSVSIFFNVLNMVPNALLYKKKKFIEIAKRTVSVTSIGGIITIVLAMNGMKYYALVINSVISAILIFFWNYVTSGLKLRYKFNKESINKIKEFSIFQFGFNVINYFARNLDNLLIGKFMGNIALGYYDKAYRLMLYPVQNLTQVITPVLHPILSDYQNNKKYIYQEYVKIAKILSLLGAFAGMVCFFCADEIIIIMFGKQWVESIDSFKILSISIWLQIVLSSAGVIFQSLGHTKEMFKSGILTTITTVLGIFVGLYFNKVEYVAIGIVVSYALHFIIVYYYLIKKVFNRELFKFYKNFIPSFLIIIFISVILKFVKFNISNILVQVIAKFILILLLFIFGLIITGEHKLILKVLIKNKR